ncbi:hypothetical protein N9B63_04710 [Akkermansiaceae bacterium]|nr:hypothetical protein [Akkermansiaceae bacterium]
MKIIFNLLIGIFLIQGSTTFAEEIPESLSLDSSANQELSATPEGLSDSDWAGIREAYQTNRHAITADGDGTYQARNPGQAWTTRFDGRGFTVTPDAGGWEWGLELKGFGKVTKVLNEGGNLSYVREGGLVEWFINDRRGLEQGWTFSARPQDAEPDGPLRLRLLVRGGLRPEIAASGSSAAFLNPSGGSALTYGGLKAWDANGKTLQVRFVEGGEDGDSIALEVEDEGARYPLTIDPVAQQTYLTASNAEEWDYLGVSVSVSGDTVVVGASGEDSNATGINGDEADNSVGGAGAAYVFVRNGITWTQQAYLKASNTDASDSFGYSVSISGDTIVVGAYQEDSSATGINGEGDDNSAIDAGAAYVFVRNGITWTQQAYLKASNTDASDSFGYSVSISGDTIVVGAYQEDSSATGINGEGDDNSAIDAGAAYVFVRNGITWTQQAYLKASNTDASDAFGLSVSVSGDTVVVGASGEDSNATGINGDEADNSVGGAGAAYVFARNGTTWSQEAYLKAAVSSGSFGLSVSISGDTVVVGAINESGYFEEEERNYYGAVYVFVRNGATWSQEAHLRMDQQSYGFGRSVTVSSDTLVVGRFNGQSASVFVRHGAIWNILQAYFSGDPWSGSRGGFGLTASVSGDMIVMGAFGATPGGAAFVFKMPESFLLSISATNGSVNGSGTYYLGDTATLTATPDLGFVFDGWTGDATGIDNPLSLVMDSNKTVGATFVPAPYSLSISATNGGVSGSGEYLADITATLTATPDPGFLFDGWTGDASGTDNPLDLVMDSNKTVGASFVRDISDADEDGLSAYEEIVIYGTDPALSDTDGDGLTDGYEAGVGRFSLVSGFLTWAQAKAAAEEAGGHLATFTTQEEWDVALGSLEPNALNAVAGAWIGATDADDEGTWTWVTGELFTFNNWAADQPDDFSNSDVAEVSGGFGVMLGKWFDTGAGVAREAYLLEIGYPTDPTVADADEDGLDDGQESTAGSNPFLSDTDSDGLTDGQEVLQTLTNPTLTDSDGNGISDTEEDRDEDGLPDHIEIIVHGTNPNLADTDDDGFDDLFELNTGFDPTLATSTPQAYSQILVAAEFRFNAADGVSYKIESSTDLENWEVIETGILGTGARVTRFYSIEGTTQRFYRAGRE